jgi:hypothetical protein
MKRKHTLFIAIAVAVAMVGVAVRFAASSNPEMYSNVAIGTEPTAPIAYTSEEIGVSSINKDIRVYNSFLDLPYFEMPFADDEVFDTLKEIYNNMDFYGEFTKGDLAAYGFFIEKYGDLLNNEAKFIDKESGAELYLREWENLKEYDDMSKYIYYYFDIDEDETPELCIIDNGGFIYIFKYVLDYGRIILWRKLDSASYQLLGSKKIAWVHLGSGAGTAFYLMSDNGEDEYSVFCYETGRYSQKFNTFETVHLIALPIYVDYDAKIVITERLINEAFRDQSYYFFRVTKEQYEEITSDLYSSIDLAKEMVKKVTFTFEQLFEGDDPR